MKRLCLFVLLCGIGGVCVTQAPKPYDTAPVLVYSVNPDFSGVTHGGSSAGKVVVSVHITEAGDVDKATVIRGVGYGRDEKVLEAVRQYRFKPALKDGRPVACDFVFDVSYLLN